MRISGDVAIVTGGASGLGAAVVAALTEAGATVAALDLPGPRLDTAGGALQVPCDVADGASAETAVETVCSSLGVPRMLINCAGVAPVTRIVTRDGAGDLDPFARVVGINLIGTFNLMRLVSARMTTLEPLETGERGLIVNTASVAAFEGQIGQTAYAASKGGVASLTLPAARELARYGIRVVAIAPGVFGTPMMLDMPQEVQDSIIADIPFPKRFGAPSEFSDLVLHVARNGFLNGTVLRLDGALRMKGK